jgi:hypothetical protein
VPTFKFLWNDVSVTDTITPFAASPDNGLQRSMTFTSAAKLENTFVRIASGQKVEESDGAIVVDGVRFTVEGAEPVLRTINDRRELLIPITAAAGEEASVKITIVW